MRRLLCALLGVGLLLGGCACGEPAAVPEPESSIAAAGESITEQEAVERVRELLIQNSQKLCTTEENIAMLQNSLFTCDGTVTVEEAECWLVKKGTGRLPAHGSGLTVIACQITGDGAESLPL